MYENDKIVTRASVVLRIEDHGLRSHAVLKSAIACSRVAE